MTCKSCHKELAYSVPDLCLKCYEKEEIMRKQTMEKLTEIYCLHRNLITIGASVGCLDCGAGDGTIRNGKKMKPLRKDVLVEKINEIVDWINQQDKKINQ